MSRLQPQPGERIDRSRTLTFSFDGSRSKRLAGDTIASALYAAGQRTFSRCFKYHRRRGLHVLLRPVPQLPRRGRRPPGRARLRRAGARGHRGRAHQRQAVARVRRDARDRPRRRPLHAARLLLQDLHPPAPPVAALREDPAKRGRASAGCASSRTSANGGRDYRRRHADVLVIGGGAAGLHAAIAAAGLGADVVLVDEGPEPGGRAARGPAARADARWSRRPARPASR